MAIGTKTINQISRTLATIQGTEMLPGRDENGDFKVEITKIIDEAAAQAAADVTSNILNETIISYAQLTAKIIKDGSSDKIIVPAFRVILDDTMYYKSNSTTLDVNDIDVGGSFIFGSDYFVWAGVPASGHEPVIKLSTSPSSPAGLTNPKIIGGFHYGKIRNSITANDVSDGIVPNSCWDIKHMPRCYLLGLADPANYQIGGMVEVVPGSLWVDIYLVSDGGGSGFNRRGFSKINQVPLSGTENLCWYDFVIRAKNVGKRLLSYMEWTQAAIGSPQGINNSNANGWTKTTNTARVKTAATEAADADANYINGYNTSLLNVRDCVGNLFEWLADAAGLGTTGWSNSLDVGEMSADTNFGQRYGTITCLIAGGNWYNGILAGSRAVFAAYGPWSVDTSVGSRFCCESL